MKKILVWRHLYFRPLGFYRVNHIGIPHFHFKQSPQTPFRRLQDKSIEIISILKPMLEPYVNYVNDSF